MMQILRKLKSTNIDEILTDMKMIYEDYISLARPFMVSHRGSIAL